MPRRPKSAPTAGAVRRERLVIATASRRDVLGGDDHMKHERPRSAGLCRTLPNAQRTGPTMPSTEPRAYPHNIATRDETSPAMREIQRQTEVKKAKTKVYSHGGWSPYHCPPGLRERFDLIPPASHGFGSFYEDPSLVLLSKRMNAVNAATAEYIDLLVSPGKRKLQKKKKRRPYMR